MINIYPRQLTFIHSQKCDVCINSGNKYNVITLPQNRLLGWNVCEKEECTLQVEEWRYKSTIPYSELIKIFGENINVMRTSGILQSGWEVYGDAFKLCKEDDWWVDICSNNKKYSKCVTLTLLKYWNKTIEI